MEETTLSIVRGLFGLLVLLAIAWAISKDKKNIPWKTVLLGLLLQSSIALGLLYWEGLAGLFEILGAFFVKILEYTGAGTEMLFGELGQAKGRGFIFVFQALPVIVFFSALTSLLYYFGVLQAIVRLLAWGLTKTLNISGAESLSVAGNIFLGQSEAPLLIKTYLKNMSQSELFLVMLGGMATVAGSVMGAYIGFLGGEDPTAQLMFAKALLAASVMAAPGAVVIAKIIYPPQQPIQTIIEIPKQNIGDNLLEAITNGTQEGVRMAVNVGAMLLVFIALIAMLSGLLEVVGEIGNINLWIRENTPYAHLSLEFLLGYIFAPLMWIIGVPEPDTALLGQLLGIKLVASEFVAYAQLADLKEMAVGGLQDPKSILMASFMLCGFANFASIGIQIGGIGILAPERRKDLIRLGPLAMVGGTLVSLISATIIGMLTL
ncbi:MAG: NupC/NupG family nucleoside CNT transporter [Flavobacteriaceae bacterium]